MLEIKMSCYLPLCAGACWGPGRWSCTGYGRCGTCPPAQAWSIGWGSPSLPHLCCCVCWREWCHLVRLLPVPKKVSKEWKSSWNGKRVPIVFFPSLPTVHSKCLPLPDPGFARGFFLQEGTFSFPLLLSASQLLELSLHYFRVLTWQF